jgi:hypothetical protein
MNRSSKEELQHWDKILDEYEQSIGLSQYSANTINNDEINKYTTMNRDEIEKLNPEDCAQISYRLSQFAFYLQRSLNRELSRYNWAEESIKDVIADEVNNYKGYGYIEKSLQAIKHNEKASGLNSIKRYAKQRSDRLQYLANNIKNLSDVMLSIQKSKVKNGS